MCAQFGGEDGGKTCCILNKSGSYGVASAQFWWGRLAGSVVRLLLKLFGSRIPTWLLLFADDFLQLSLGPKFLDAVTLWLFTLRVLGIPLSWKKIKGGFVVPWIGYEINVREYTLEISETRA